MATTLNFAGEAVVVTGGLICFVVGLFHGAADEQQDGLRRFSWSAGVTYLIVAVAIAALFLVYPLGGPTAFLVMSM